MSNPEISVVCAVYNGAPGVAATLDGILAQVDVSMEVVVVNDGSTDGTTMCLDDYAARDERVRVEHQENCGITAALVRGCRVARGEYIARHDAQDISAPSRLKQQVEALRSESDVALVSSWVRFSGPEQEPAGAVRQAPESADNALAITERTQKRVRGPYHGSVMFRRMDYEAVGGYRSEFYFAQDVDLWLRLHERGRHHIVPKELYTAQLDPDSISGRHRAEQDRCLELAVAAAWARRAGGSEAPYLAQAAKVRPSNPDGTPRPARLQAGSLYSMGCHLLAESPGSASRYFVRSLRVYPFNPKAWIRLVESVGRRWRLLS